MKVTAKNILILTALTITVASIVIFLKDSKKESPVVSQITSLKDAEKPKVESGVKFQSAPFKHIAQTREQKVSSESDSSNQQLSKQKFEDAFSKFGTDNTAVKALLKNAIELDHSNAKALGFLAGMLLNDGNKDEARELAADCIAFDRKNADCYTTLISSYTRYGEFDNSYSVLSDCLIDTPDNIHCLGGMETYYLNAGQLNDAKRILDQITQLDPNSLWTHMAQASYFEKTGDFQNAALEYEKACKMGQSFACQRLKDVRSHE